MNDCYYTKKDWRQCKDEVSHNGWMVATTTRSVALMLPLHVWIFMFAKEIWRYPTESQEADCSSMQMEAFRECWKRKGNDERTETKDA